MVTEKIIHSEIHAVTIGFAIYVKNQHSVHGGDLNIKELTSGKQLDTQNNF